MAESFDQLVDENKEELKAANRSLMLMVALTTFVGLGIAVCVALFLPHRFVGAIQAVLAQAKAIAAGDLTGEELLVRSQDELGDLTAAVNQMSGSLKHMIVAISRLRSSWLLQLGANAFKPAISLSMSAPGSIEQLLRFCQP